MFEEQPTSPTRRGGTAVKALRHIVDVLGGAPGFGADAEGERGELRLATQALELVSRNTRELESIARERAILSDALEAYAEVVAPVVEAAASGFEPPLAVPSAGRMLSWAQRVASGVAAGEPAPCVEGGCPPFALWSDRVGAPRVRRAVNALREIRGVAPAPVAPESLAQALTALDDAVAALATWRAREVELDAARVVAGADREGETQRAREEVRRLQGELRARDENHVVRAMAAAQNEAALMKAALSSFTRDMDELAQAVDDEDADAEADVVREGSADAVSATLRAAVATIGRLRADLADANGKLAAAAEEAEAASRCDAELLAHRRDINAAHAAAMVLVRDAGLVDGLGALPQREPSEMLLDVTAVLDAARAAFAERAAASAAAVRAERQRGEDVVRARHSAWQDALRVEITRLSALASVTGKRADASSPDAADLTATGVDGMDELLRVLGRHSGRLSAHFMQQRVRLDNLTEDHRSLNRRIAAVRADLELLLRMPAFLGLLDVPLPVPEPDAPDMEVLHRLIGFCATRLRDGRGPALAPVEEKVSAWSRQVRDLLLVLRPVLMRLAPQLDSPDSEHSLALPDGRVVSALGDVPAADEGHPAVLNGRLRALERDVVQLDTAAAAFTRRMSELVTRIAAAAARNSSRPIEVLADSTADALETAHRLLDAALSEAQPERPASPTEATPPASSSALSRQQAATLPMSPQSSKRTDGAAAGVTSERASLSAMISRFDAIQRQRGGAAGMAEGGRSDDIANEGTAANDRSAGGARICRLLRDAFRALQGMAYLKYLHVGPEWRSAAQLALQESESGEQTFEGAATQRDAEAAAQLVAELAQLLARGLKSSALLVQRDVDAAQNALCSSLRTALRVEVGALGFDKEIVVALVEETDPAARMLQRGRFFYARDDDGAGHTPWVDASALVAEIFAKVTGACLEWKQLASDDAATIDRTVDAIRGAFGGPSQRAHWAGDLLAAPDADLYADLPAVVARLCADSAASRQAADTEAVQRAEEAAARCDGLQAQQGRLEEEIRLLREDLRRGMRERHDLELQRDTAESAAAVARAQLLQHAATGPVAAGVLAGPVTDDLPVGRSRGASQHAEELAESPVPARSADPAARGGDVFLRNWAAALDREVPSRLTPPVKRRVPEAGPRMVVLQQGVTAVAASARSSSTRGARPSRDASPSRAVPVVPPPRAASVERHPHGENGSRRPTPDRRATSAPRVAAERPLYSRPTAAAAGRITQRRVGGGSGGSAGGSMWR